MTNREKYKKAFSAVYPSNEFSWEVEKMKRIKRRHIFKTMAASIAGCMIFMASATAAYAMDVGGIQRTIQLWKGMEAIAWSIRMKMGIRSKEPAEVLHSVLMERKYLCQKKKSWSI